MKKDVQPLFDEFLAMYDWEMRRVEEQQRYMASEEDTYLCGYADGVGQCILNAARALDCEDYTKFEAYKRVMQFASAKKYTEEYPEPINDYDKWSKQRG